MRKELDGYLDCELLCRVFARIRFDGISARRWGGDTSIRSFIKKDLAEKDCVHLKKAGAELMADRMLCAMTTDLRAYLATHPDAGCR